MIYAHNEVRFLTIDQELLAKDGYPLGKTVEDYYLGFWVKLNDDQVKFHEDHPEASPAEVIDMKLKVPSLDEVKEKKLEELKKYDSSDDVNSFLLNGVKVWIEESRRSGMRNSIDSAELLGESEVTFNITGIEFTVSLINARTMLARIQRYADRAYLATESHKSAIKALTSVDEVEAYDFTTGYPEKESFTL